jgi:predicted nuclease of predicted toxin-antitoxin system
MSIRIVVDMNLSPEWIPVLRGQGHETLHWSAIGNPRATDAEIMKWALDHRFVVLTHDFDFGEILALTHAAGPSVIHARGQNMLPEHMSAMILATIQRHEKELSSGALVIVAETRSRVRILPL